MFAAFKPQMKSMLFWPIYLMRRLSLAITTVVFRDYQGLQITLVTIASLLMINYGFKVQPFEIPVDNFLLIFNESIVLVCTLHLHMFSLGSENVEFINNVGWSYAAMIFLQVIVNLGIKAIGAGIKVFMFLKKKYL